MATAGSQQTVQRLVDDNYSALYRYAYRLSGSAADADDLTQDSFCKAQLNFRAIARSQSRSAMVVQHPSQRLLAPRSRGSAGALRFARRRV